MKTIDKLTLSAIIPPEYAGQRVDQALARLFPQLSRTKLQGFIRAQQVTLDHQPKRPRDIVAGGEHVIIHASLETQGPWEGEDIHLDIVYEDDALIIVNKPAGLVVHPAAGHWEGTLVNALLHHAPALKKLPRAGIIHRLDKQTSGLLVVAKTIAAHTFLTRQMQKRKITREYEAIVQGIMTAGGTVNQPVGRHPIHRQRMTVTDTGKEAITHYRVLERFRTHTHIRLQLDTGRTHQIRVHMAYIHYPVLGDPTYSGRPKLPPQASAKLIDALQHFHRQALHAKHLALTHPETRELMAWDAPLPKDMLKLLTLFRKDKGSA